MRLKFLIAALFMLAGGPAWSQSCTFANTGLDWGDIDLALGTAFNLNGTFTANCTGTPGTQVRICPNFNAGSGGVNGTGSERYMLNGANQLRYNIYRNAGRTNVWGSRTWGLPPNPPAMTVNLNGAGTGTSSETMFARVLAGQTTLPAGLYTSVFSGAHTEIAYAYSTVGNCNAIGLANVTNVPFTAQAMYRGTCTVSATNLDFGSRGILDTAATASNTISVTCTTGASYTIGLSGGNAAATDPTLREMANPGNTEFITYGIYRDLARTLPWGSTIGSDTVAATGNGSAQAHTAYGHVPAQATPSPQTYTDTIIVTVTY